MEVACNNVTNGSSHPDMALDYSLASTPIVVAGTLAFVLVLPLVLFEIRPFPMGAASAVLLGAMLMVLGQVIDQAEVYHILGERSNLTTILLLLGMMLVAQYFEREKLINFLLKRFLRKDLSFTNYIWRINLMSAILSALFTNDASCAIITPLLLKHWQTHDRPFIELELILLGIATSSNIGSVTTVFGNPQMALIAAKTTSPLFFSSQLNLRVCFIYLLPIAIFSFALNVGFLVLFYQIKFDRLRKRDKESIANRPSSTAALPEKTASNGLNDGRDLETNPTGALQSSANEAVEMQAIVRNNAAVRLAEMEDLAVDERDEIAIVGVGSTVPSDFTPSKSKPFMVVICLALVATVVLFLASGHPVTFDMGLVPMGAAVIIITADALLNRRNALPIVRRVDWSILLMFLGIFVWMHGINSTRLPRFIWKGIGLAGADYLNPIIIVIFSVFVVIGSNLFSNVPLTIIVLEQLEPCEDQLAMVLMLAWTATLAGNLTLFGSVANLIVADKGLQTVGYRLSFWRYLRYGLPTTVIIVLLGTLILLGLLHI